MEMSNSFDQNGVEVAKFSIETLPCTLLKALIGNHVKLIFINTVS